MYGGTFPYYNLVPRIGPVPKRRWQRAVGSGKIRISKKARNNPYHFRVII